MTAPPPSLSPRLCHSSQCAWVLVQAGTLLVVAGAATAHSCNLVHLLAVGGRCHSSHKPGTPPFLNLLWTQGVVLWAPPFHLCLAAGQAQGVHVGLYGGGRPVPAQEVGRQAGGGKVDVRALDHDV